MNKSYSKFYICNHNLTLNHPLILLEYAVAQSLHSAKETWNDNKIKEIEQILSNARKQWFTELNFNKQESTVGFTSIIAG
jgi:hypothetical protein